MAWPDSYENNQGHPAFKKKEKKFIVIEVIR